MRHLIFTRGLPGSGKSTTLAKLGLAPYTVSKDVVRRLLSSPTMQADGRIVTRSEYDPVVWELLQKLLTERLARGDTTVVDAVHATERNIQQLLDLASRHRASLACLDFTEVPRDRIDRVCAERLGSPDYVPMSSIERFAEIIAQTPLSGDIARIVVKDDGSHQRQLAAWLDEPVTDLSAYRAVVHVGDLQGCYTVLMDALGPEGLRDDTFYIFVGDMCDRGIENGPILRWMAQAAQRPNVVVLEGNHEAHLRRHIAGEEPVSDEFAQRTLPDLQRHAVDNGVIRMLTNKLRDVFRYEWNGRRVQVTHGGLPTVPQHFWMMSAQTCINGTGHWDDDVDAAFDRLAPPGWVQVHGHRNKSRKPVQAAERSFNLENSVEFGGTLRLVTLDERGWTPREQMNHVFAPLTSRLESRRALVPHFLTRENDMLSRIPPENLLALRNHSGVNETQTTMYPNISSFSFTKNVFFDKSWDEVTVKARGLFVEKDTGIIVARSYDKFFNLNESRDMTLDAMRERLVFPLVSYVKENGFLGLCSNDHTRDALFISSKSRPDSPFAAMLAGQLRESMSAEKLEHFRRDLRDMRVTAAFEVIDPIADPHITDYQEAHLVLLDMVHNTVAGETLTYPELKKVGAKHGLAVKNPGPRLPDWHAFERWYAQLSSTTANETEGYVMTDASGYQFKVKTPFYSFWKLMRGQKDRIAKLARNGLPPDTGSMGPFLETRGLGFLTQTAHEFRDWCRQFDADELTATPISTLRSRFLQEPRLELEDNARASSFSP